MDIFCPLVKHVMGGLPDQHMVSCWEIVTEVKCSDCGELYKVYPRCDHDQSVCGDCRRKTDGGGTTDTEKLKIAVAALRKIIDTVADMTETDGRQPGVFYAEGCQYIAQTALASLKREPGLKKDEP